MRMYHRISDEVKNFLPAGEFPIIISRSAMQVDNLELKWRILKKNWNYLQMRTVGFISTLYNTFRKFTWYALATVVAIEYKVCHNKPTGKQTIEAWEKLEK
ncbi:MAG: hypothetical protein IPH61_15235 [Bacteroidetes bacterium]|nr:hypothetical protein [Bacteroidota bacterium]